jgi:hypothetical protein
MNRGSRDATTHQSWCLAVFRVQKRFQFAFLLGCEKKRSLKYEMDEAAKRKQFAEKNEHLLYAFNFEEISS